nr:hypothetical protein pFRL5_353 [Streptomyces sp. F8]
MPDAGPLQPDRVQNPLQAPRQGPPQRHRPRYHRLRNGLALPRSIRLLFPAKRATPATRLVDHADPPRPRSAFGLAPVRALRQRWEPRCGFAGKARRSSTRTTMSNHRRVVGVEQRTTSLRPGDLDAFLILAFPQVRSVLRVSPENLGSLLIPECTITSDVPAAVHDREEPLLDPPLPRPLRPRFVQPRGAVHADSNLFRGDVLSLFSLGRIGHDPQLRSRTPAVGGRHRRHHHPDPGTRHTPAPHLQQPLLDQPVNHPGRLRGGTPQHPRDRRIRTIPASRHRPAHQPYPTIRPGSQHQPQQRQPLRRRPATPPSTKQTRRRLPLTHRRPPRREQRLTQRQQDGQLTLLHHQSLRVAPGLSGSQWQ